MNETPSVLRRAHIYSCLLPAILIMLHGYPVTVAAHAGVHEQIAGLSRLIEQDPANEQLYVSRGKAHHIHGSLDKAVSDFIKALDIDPGNVAAETSLGRIYLEQGYHGKAIVHLDSALASQAHNVRAVTTRAQANKTAGKPLLAAQDYRHAIEQSRKQGKPLPDYYLGCARAYSAAGSQYIGNALRCLDEGIKLLGNIRSLELYAVELEVGRNSLDAAQARLGSMLARAGRKEFLLLQRGDILSASGNTAAALLDYHAAQKAIDSLPQQHRNSSSVLKLRRDLDTRLDSHENTIEDGS